MVSSQTAALDLNAPNNATEDGVTPPLDDGSLRYNPPLSDWRRPGVRLSYIYCTSEVTEMGLGRPKSKGKWVCEDKIDLPRQWHHFLKIYFQDFYLQV